MSKGNYGHVSKTIRKGEFDKKGVSRFTRCPKCDGRLNKVFVKKGFMRYEALGLGKCLKCSILYSIKWGRMPREVSIP